jgi:adenine deaminase
MNTAFSITGTLVDIPAKELRPVEIQVLDGRIAAIRPCKNPEPGFIMPGFVDAHIHIESSMLTPARFAEAALPHGTLSTVSDPHEIGNVCGTEGLDFMVNNAKGIPFHFCFGVPSCVPATTFETAGAVITAQQVAERIVKPEWAYLSEVMNVPGVLFKDPELMAKIAATHAAGKPVDGHAPGLRGKDALRYVQAGIQTDHECVSLDEAEEKLSYGMKILIREGSAARNFEALWPLLNSHPDQVMLCSDDKHPDELLLGHINVLVSRAVALGVPVFKVLQAACINPLDHYRIPLGRLRLGDSADFIRTNDLVNFQVVESYFQGEKVAENGKAHFQVPPSKPVNRFFPFKLSLEDLRIPSQPSFQAIVAEDGQLLTKSETVHPPAKNGEALAAPEQNLLKLVVVNRYHQAPPAVAFIRNIGLKKGAFASSVAHDSHNVIAVGADDASLLLAIERIRDMQGGVSAALASENINLGLPLPYAGLMSDASAVEVGNQYSALDAQVKSWGSALRAPYMTLSFMALLVIPELKLSDKGLFDGKRFTLLDQHQP